MVDFLFIDGGHDSTTVTADYNNYSRYVRNDGVIAFHDTMHEMGVKNLWLRIKHGRKMVEINKQYGIGVLWK
jgi:predicted O-methyltransferase YrrM